MQNINATSLQTRTSKIDFNGTVLYKKNFVLQKGHDRTHTIKVHDGIPSGILFHHFVFEDGSQISIETCK